MTNFDLKASLAFLKLDVAEAAKLLDVSERTVRRWADGEEIPGPARAAFDAWRRLAERHLPWRPDELSLRDNDREQIEGMRAHAKDFATLLRLVESRGGPRNPWTVDLTAGRATFGPFKISFYKLANGGFSLSSYSRADQPPDFDEDSVYLQDASYCIARELAKIGPVRESLQAVARYTRENSRVSAWGKVSPSPDEAERRRSSIEAVADALEELAIDPRASNARFEDLLKHLHSLGFHPPIGLVSDVARAFVGLERISAEHAAGERKRK